MQVKRLSARVVSTTVSRVTLSMIRTWKLVPPAFCHRKNGVRETLEAPTGVRSVGLSGQAGVKERIADQLPSAIWFPATTLQ